MFGEKNDYKFLVTVLLLAIASSIIFHIFLTPKDYPGFTEVYFEDPNNLPSKIQPGDTYDFSFTINNLEEKPSVYDLESKIELYNLYDATEGIYKCAARNSEKIKLTWEEKTTHQVIKFSSTTTNHIFIQVL